MGRYSTYLREAYETVMGAGETVVLDIETTGFSREKHAEIIEIGAVKLDVRRRKITGVFSQLIRPSDAFTISARITNLTTIDWPQVKDMPYIEEVLPRLYEFIGDRPVVAHNAAFDWDRFLVPGFLSVGLHAANPVVCTMTLAKGLYPNLGKKGYNLESLCKKYGTDIEGHHRAYVDCKYTASLLLRLLDDYKVLHGAGLECGDKMPVTKPGTADFSNLRVYRIAHYDRTPRLGPKIYVYTNLGVVFYTPNRKLWTVQDLRTDDNAPAQEWGRAILSLLGKSESAFVASSMAIA